MVAHYIYVLLPYLFLIVVFSSVQFSCSVVSDSLQAHGLQHARPPCPSPIPGVYSNSYPLSRWCHPTISSSVIPFCFKSFPSSGYFPMELQLQHQSFQWIFRTDFLYDWPVGSPCSPRDSQESSPTPQFKSINSLVLSFLHGPNYICRVHHEKRWAGGSTSWNKDCWE